MDINRLETIWEPWLKKGDYQADFSRHLKNRQNFYQLITKYLKANSWVLEIGCGTAIDTNILAAKYDDINFYATDISAKSILLSSQISSQGGNNIFLVQGDIKKLYFKNKSFDVIFSQGVLEHFTDPVTVINEQLRVLKDDGVLIISVPQKYTAYTLMKKIKMRNKTWEWEWETEYSYEGLKSLCSKCGLSEVESVGYQYWLSWWEVAWVLRDIFDKIYRRVPCKNIFPLPLTKQYYDKLWNFLEQKWGVYFLQNLAMVFVKNKTKK